jgi:hypothetical protein
VTDHARVSVSQNGPAVQVYFRTTFAADSAFPLDAGDECVAWITGDGGVHLLPLDQVGDTDYPASIEGPPRDALPPRLRAAPEASTDGPTDEVDVDRLIADFASNDS